MTSFLTSLLSAITRPWRRPAEPGEPEPFAALAELMPGLVWTTDALPELHPDDLPRFEAAFESRQPFELEYRQRRHDGEFRWMVSRGTPRFDRGGIFCGYVGVALEIHDNGRHAERSRGTRTDGGAPAEPSASPDPSSTVGMTRSVPDLHLKQILVVDREAATLDFTAELLRQCGARVTIARSAAEAILALHQHHDLVVTDNAVPVTEGVMLAQQLRQANGGLPAIVLRKPIDGAELASEIAQLFTRSGGA